MENTEKGYVGHQILRDDQSSISAQCNTREMSKAEKLNELFSYHAPRSTETANKYETIRIAAKHLAHVIIKNTPHGSDQSASIRLLREAVMTANASIALDGLNF